MLTSYLLLSWDEYHTAAQHLAATILSDNKIFDHIVAISRGGLTLGHMFADLLCTPISTISIQSYTDIQTQGTVALTTYLQIPIKGQRILLVDDVADSGKTLKRAVSYLRDLAPANVTTVTMYYKPHSVFKPDYYAHQTTKWLMFPYEMTEMILLITNKMEKEGKTKATIQTFLEKLGYTHEQLAFVRKYHLP